MKIAKPKQKKSKLLTFRSLKCGDLFRVTSCTMATISMKINPERRRASGWFWNAVNLETNILETWRGDEPVILVKATLTEEG